MIKFRLVVICIEYTKHINHWDIHLSSVCQPLEFRNKTIHGLNIPIILRGVLTECKKHMSGQVTALKPSVVSHFPLVAFWSYLHFFLVVAIWDVLTHIGEPNLNLAFAACDLESCYLQHKAAEDGSSTCVSDTHMGSRISWVLASTWPSICCWGMWRVN